MARILIAEHNQATSGYLQTALKKSGNSVRATGTGLETWRATSEEIFDILIVNIVMPGVDGFTLAQRALYDNPELQVIFVTGFAGVVMNTQDTPSYAPAPMVGHPFHIKEIAGYVRTMLGYAALPQKAAPTLSDSNVVYADFSRKESAVQQHASH